MDFVFVAFVVGPDERPPHRSQVYRTSCRSTFFFIASSVDAAATGTVPRAQLHLPERLAPYSSRGSIPPELYRTVEPFSTHHRIL